MENINNLDELDKALKEAELKGTTCALDHETPHQAVNYLYQKFNSFDLMIPVCEECISKLYSEDWKLWYCVECCESKWIHKIDSKHPELYQKGGEVKWIKACPKCYLDNVDGNLKTEN